MNMECTLATLHALIACFSWSNLYIDSGISFQDSDAPHTEWVTRTNHAGNAIETVTALESSDEPYNPYGRAALGYELRFGAVTLSGEAFYSRSLDDNGPAAVKGIAIKARWYLFR
jgi:hypothetical protein